MNGFIKNASQTILKINNGIARTAKIMLEKQEKVDSLKVTYL